MRNEMPNEEKKNTEISEKIFCEIDLIFVRV
jgi:hypothetical protein